MRIAFGVANTLALFNGAQIEAFERGGFGKVPFFPKAIETLMWAVRSHQVNLVFVTKPGREQLDADLLQEWLKYWLDGFAASLINVHVVDDDSKKAVLCQELEVNVVVDENAEVVQSVRDYGIVAIHYSTWNCINHVSLQRLLEEMRMPPTEAVLIRRSAEAQGG